MTQKENQKFADDFAFDFSNNFDELKKRLDDCAVALIFNTFEEYEVFRDECNRLKELEQSQIKQIKELKQSQKQLAYDELWHILFNFDMYADETNNTMVSVDSDGMCIQDYILARLRDFWGYRQ